MKRALSILIVAVMILSMIPAVYAEESGLATSSELLSLVDETVTATGYTFEYVAETAGTLTVIPGTCTPGYRYKVYGPGYESIPFTKWSASHDHEITAGTWTVVFYAYTSTAGDVAGKVSFDVTFTPAEGGGEEVVKEEYQISETALVLGDNNLSLLETAVTTIYVFEPAETGVYTFTAPEGSILGYWGAGSWFLSDPNSTTNTYEWTCTGVGQSAYIGVSGVDGSFNLNVAKTGDYTVVETPIVAYENKATLETFTLPEGSKLGSYIDVAAETVHTAVLGEDGYYHLNSIDGPIILVDMNYQDIILSNALLSDRPVMYAYTTDENGNNVKYDIGEAIKEYEAVMDANGYYPLTEDLILFYDVYAVGAGTYTFYVTSSYNEENVWMYCMRTVTFPEVTEPEETEPEVTEPEVTEPEVTEPEVTEPEVTEPEATEPEVTEPEVTEPEVTEPSEPADPNALISVTNEAVTVSGYVFEYTAASAGTLHVSVGECSPGWRYKVYSPDGIESGYRSKYTAGTECDYKNIAGNWKIVFYAYDSNTAGNCEGTVSFTVTFTPDEASGGETEKTAYEVSSTELTVGSNTLTLLDTAVTTIFKFKPAEAGTYTFTAPEGAIAGNWGSNAYYMNDPNSTTNSCEWTCSSVGQSVYIGVSGVDGEFILTVAKVEVTEPEETEPEVTEPEETEPEATEPSEPSEPSEPEVTEAPSEPEPSEPEVTNPDIGENVVFAVTTNAETTYHEYGSEIISAITSVQGSATVILYKDIDLGSSFITVTADQNITLDLNGCTLTTKKTSGGVISVDGTLTVQDSSAAGDGLISNTATSSDRGILVNSTGILNLYSGTISSKTQAVRVDSGKMTMTGGNISATQYGVYGGGTANVAINGGTISVNVGTFYHAVYGGGSATMIITNGYFDGGALNSSGLIGGISGGYFTTAPTTSMLATGCTVENNDDATYLYKVVDPNAVPEEPEEPTEPEKVVEEWNLVLDDDLLVNFYLNLADDAQVQVSVADKSVTYSASELETNADGKYIVSVRLAAAQMTDAITIQVVGSEEEAVTYTVRQYADTVLANSELSAYHALVKELLNYGGAAQNYFTYNTENLANANINDVAAEDVPESAEEIVVRDKISTLKFYGASLVYRDKIAVRFYFTGSVEGIDFGDYTAVEKEDGLYYVEVADILPQDLDKQITLTATDAEGNEISVTYSPMNYIVRMNANGNDNLKALLKALYNYHLAAKALRAAS